MPSTPGLFRRWTATACLLCCLSVGSLHAQQPPAGGPDPTVLFNTAVNAFDRGDYQGAVTNIKNLFQTTTLDPNSASPADIAKLSKLLEPMYFTLGAAYFNLKDYAGASSALQDYIKRYPGGARVPEAQFSLAQANYFSKNYAAAAAAFAALENNPKYREDALLLEGISFHEANDLDKATAALERLVNGGIRSQTTARGAMQLIAYYSEKKQTDKAFKMLALVQANIAQVENVVELNSIALSQGDTFLQAEKYEEALTCYRAVRVRGEVISLQQDRLVAAQRRLESIKAAMRANPKEAGQYYITLRQAQDTINDDTKLVQDFEKLPPYRPKLLYRMGRAFNGMGKTWESVVVYNDSLNAAKDNADKEPALYALLTTYADLNQAEEARANCERYLKEFPEGANAPTVGYLLGATALQANDPKMAETYFGRMLQSQPNSSFREEMKFLLANAQFAQGEYDKARTGYNGYLGEYASGQHAEDAVYRLALCSLFSGKYDDAEKEIDAYLTKYPNGAAEPDARYRRAVCEYAYNQYDNVIKACQDWIKKFPGDQQTGEVEALLGDSFAAKDKADEALSAYVKSYKAATTDEVLNYSIMEANKILQKKGDWERIGNMFEEFVKDKPDHPTAVAAAYWIGRALTKEGKPDEAKRFVADMAKKYIDDPKKEAVEQLLNQLVTLCLRKKPAAKPVDAGGAVTAPGAVPSGSPAADAAAIAATSDKGAAAEKNLSGPADTGTVAAATPVPTPEATPVDPGAEMDELLGAALTDRTPTARARILYTKAQLAQMRRQPAEYERNLLAIARDFKPEVLSAPILGQLGDLLVSKNRLDDAIPFYQHLMDYYPKSDLVDFAYAGQGEIAFQKKEYDKALEYFQDGANKIPANMKLKELTVGQAKTLLALGKSDKLDEAKKLFEQAASVREWRGETTAFSVYSLGEIEAKKDRWAEANAYYTRVYVAYQKFLPWVAKAYLGSGQSLEKLGKKEDAIRTYQEMLRNQKLADFPETSQARERLAALGAS